MINNGTQIGFNNPSSWSWLDETAVNTLITTHNEDVWSHQEIINQQALLSSQLRDVHSTLWDKADKLTTYTKTETDALVTSSGWDPIWTFSFFEDIILMSWYSNSYTIWLSDYVSGGWVYISKNNTSQLNFIDSLNKYRWVSCYFCNWTSSDRNFNTLYEVNNWNTDTIRYKLQDYSKIILENRICFLWTDLWKSAISKFWFSDWIYLSYTVSSCMYIQYNQSTWNLTLNIRNASSVWLQTITLLSWQTDTWAKQFHKIKMLLENNLWSPSLKIYIDWILVLTTYTDIPNIDTNLYVRYMHVEIWVSSVMSRTFLDYTYFKAVPNYL